MEIKEKNRKLKFIGTTMDLRNGRFKDSEINRLFELASDPEKCNGQTKSIKSESTGWSSDGNFTREEETTYTFKVDERGIRIEVKYQYLDDDGQIGNRDTEHNSGRDILNLIKTIFKN